jgi:hypothetical protein
MSVSPQQRNNAHAHSAKKSEGKETMHADCQTQRAASWGLLSPLFLSSLPLRNVTHAMVLAL